MSHSQRIFIALALVALTTIYTQCPDHTNEPGIAQQYFKEPLDITPYNLDYSVGDTVWLHVSIPGKILNDTIKHQQVHYDSAYFNTNLSAVLLYNNPLVADGSAFVSFVYTQGVSASEYTNGYVTTANIIFGCNQVTNYDMQVGVVFLKKGVFGLGLSAEVQKCYSNMYEYNQVAFYFTVSDSHYNLYTQLPFGDIGAQEDAGTVNALNAKTEVCVNVQ